MNLWTWSTDNYLLLSYRVPQSFCTLLQICLAGLSITAIFRSFLYLKKITLASFDWNMSISLCMLQHCPTSQNSDFCSTELSMVIVFLEGIFEAGICSITTTCVSWGKRDELTTQRYWRLLNMGQKWTGFLSADQEHWSDYIIKLICSINNFLLNRLRASSS